MGYTVGHMKKRLTSTTRITSKYQTVIPADVRRQLKLRVHDQLSWQIVEGSSAPMIMVSPQQKNVRSRVFGLGKHVWKGVNVERYLKNLRSEWPR